jgi:hypothetical protein
MLYAERNATQPLVGVAVATEMTSIGKELFLKLR